MIIRIFCDGKMNTVMINGKVQSLYKEQHSSPVPFIITFGNSTLYSVDLLFFPAITGILGNLYGYCNSKVTEILLNKRLPYDFKWGNSR